MKEMQRESAAGYENEDISARKIRSGQSFLFRKNGYDSTVLDIRMKDEISSGCLDAALRKTALRFPYLTDKLAEKQGNYYLLPDDIPLRAASSQKFCPLGSTETGYHLIDVTYTENSIRVAFHHALCDGRGIKPFVETLVYYYCSIKYKKTFSAEGIRTAAERPDDTETAEPFGTELFAVDKSKIAVVDRDGFALPESTSATAHCFRTEITVNQNEFVNTAKSYGATPGILTAILISSAVYRLHPEADKSVVCSMAADLRSAAGMEHTHRNCTGSIYLPYSRGDAHAGAAELAAAYRKLLSEQRTEDSLKELMNKQIMLFNRADSFKTVEGKRGLFAFLDNLCINTYVVSYLGKMNFNDFENYIDSVHLYSGQIKGLSVNMVAAGNKIAFDFLQGFESNIYVEAFIAELARHGIDCSATDTFSFTTGRDMSYITAGCREEQ